MIRIASLLTLIAMSCFTPYLSAADCSKSEIDHYLQSGFSHEQVVKLCTSVSKAIAAPVNSHAQNNASRSVVTKNNTSNNEALFFKLAIKAKKVDLQNNAMTYIAKECMKFGLEDMTGEKDELCRDVKTTIHYTGLTVINANEGVFLIAKRELMVGGNIQRELVDSKKIPARFKADFLEDFVKNPKTLNIPIRDSADPEEVGQRLLDKAA